MAIRPLAYLTSVKTVSKSPSLKVSMWSCAAATMDCDTKTELEPMEGDESEAKSCRKMKFLKMRSSMSQPREAGRSVTRTPRQRSPGDRNLSSPTVRICARLLLTALEPTDERETEDELSGSLQQSAKLASVKTAPWARSDWMMKGTASSASTRVKGFPIATGHFTT